MTINELIMELEQYDGDTEVRLAQQPNWPFEYSVGDIAEADDGKVYIGEGSQLGYLSGEAREALGW